MRRYIVGGLVFFGSVANASAVGVGNSAGAWMVPSNYPGRHAAAYLVGPDGGVLTVSPAVPGDVPMHLMHGGKFRETKDGLVFEMAPQVYEAYAAGLKGDAGKAFKALRKGVPVKVEGEGAARKMTFDVPPALKDWFTGGKAISPEDLRKVEREREEQRREIESYRWRVTETKPCENADVTANSLSPGSEKLFRKFFVPDATFRFKRNGSELALENSVDPKARTAYYASPTEKSVGVVWFDRGEAHQVKLMDQGEIDSARPGVHRFQADVGGKCLELVAAQERGGGTSGSTAGGAKAGAAD